MYFIKKRILVFMAILICCQTSVPSADPHPKDPNLGEFSVKKGRRESPDFEQKLFIPPYVAVPEQRTVEPLRSKNDMFEEFKKAQSAKDEIKVEAEKINKVIDQFKKENAGQIKIVAIDQ